MISIASVPQQVDGVTTESAGLNKCGMLVKWEVPDNGGSTITGFKVEVQGSDTSFYNYEGCKGIENNCVITLRDLAAAPYRLNDG